MAESLVLHRHSSIRSSFDQITIHKPLSPHTFIKSINYTPLRHTPSIPFAIVPEFPRYLDPIKDFIARDVPSLPGFNGNDVARLLFSDIIDPSNFYTLLLLFSCAIAFLSFEAPELYDEIKDERQLEELEEKFRKESPNVAQDIENRDKALQEKLAQERKRGLAWLALITSIAIWCTGAVNKSNPFQP